MFKERERARHSSRRSSDAPTLPPKAMTVILLSAAISTSPVFPQLFSNAKWKPVKHWPLNCSGKNEEVNGVSKRPFHMESNDNGNIDVHQERLQSMNCASEKTHNNIWQLFREAQRNILYLNKQCLMALEELDEMKREQKLLLDKIEQLEVKGHAFSGEDLLSISSELRLRIDSMVLTGTIDAREASALRSLVTDSKVSISDNFSDILYKRDAEILAELRHFSVKRKMKGFHIIHICTEMAPVISVGSLASYVTGLSQALLRKGNLVEVILPKYASLNLDEIKGLREIEADLYSYFNGQLHRNRIWTGVVYGIGVTFIEPVQYSSFFSCERIYGYSNDFERFTYFSRASLDYIVKSGKQPDVLHIHNWETSIVGPLFWDVFANQGLGATRILLTCQSFDSQCVEPPDKLALCGLDPSRLHRPDRLQDNSKAHLVNILKGGVVYSNKVVAMSSLHSKGHIIHNLSNGLEPTLAIHKDKLLIAPVGFNSSTWNPTKDKFLPQCYSKDDMRGKAVCKDALQQHLGLPEHAATALVGCILSEVSDVDLDSLKMLVWIAAKKGAQLVFMASNEIQGINRELESYLEDLKDENIRFLKEYDEALFHLIFAGSDFILCPFDDPGLQLVVRAIRYGTAPIPVTSDPRFRQFIENDFWSTKFSEYISNTFANVTLSQALDEIRNNPLQWNRKIVDAMAKDFSWDAECCDIHVSAYTSVNNQ